MNKIRLALQIAHEIAQAELQRCESNRERAEGTQFEEGAQRHLSAAQTNLATIEDALLDYSATNGSI